MKAKIYKGTYVVKTDIGQRRMTNEDQSCSMINADGDVLLLVADGMGGHNKGEYASSTAATIIREEFNKKQSFSGILTAYIWLQNTIKKANKTIYEYSQTNKEYRGMGTTLVVTLIRKNKIIIASIGDSRIYMLKNGKLNQLTDDQTYVNYLVKTGQIKPEEATTHKDRHVLTNALGIFPSLSLNMGIIDNEGHSLVLCSDGLYNNISESELYQILTVNETTAQKVDTAIRVANNNGGSDNISLAFWEAIKND